jgi:hypothetical protein
MGEVAASAIPVLLENAKELVTLCRSGRLDEVEKWIAAVKPLEFLLQRTEKAKRCFKSPSRPASIALWN